MAKISIVLQALTDRFHADILRKMLTSGTFERFVASVAFVKKSGVDAIAKELTAVAKGSTFFVGIRNDITSLQALRRLRDLGVKVIAVDTGSRSTIYHPKVFMAIGKKEATAIIGSANMTFNGLHNNIEVGALLYLDLSDREDGAFVNETVAMLDGLLTNFPEHVFVIDSPETLDRLFNEGRLTDEDVVQAPSVTAFVRKGERDLLRPMKLRRHGRVEQSHKKSSTATGGASTRPSSQKTGKKGANTACASKFERIWESREIKERDLNIPRASGTHATGSMLWKKGALDDIDQRHFFRDIVFADLDWQLDNHKAHYERTQARFQIVVKGIDCGVFTLKLSHKTDTKSESYRQRQPMTSLHWGIAKKIIAKHDLLGRIMSLYRKDGAPPEFLLEID